MTQRRASLPPLVVLSSVGPGTWDECAALQVTPEQGEFVAPVARYLAMGADDESPGVRMPFVHHRQNTGPTMPHRWWASS